MQSYNIISLKALRGDFCLRKKTSNQDFRRSKIKGVIQPGSTHHSSITLTHHSDTNILNQKSQNKKCHPHIKQTNGKDCPRRQMVCWTCIRLDHPRRCTKRHHTSLKVIEEDAGIGVPPGIHANPHAPIMDGGSDSAKSFQVFLHHFPPIIFLSKDEGQRVWGKEKRG